MSEFPSPGLPRLFYEVHRWTSAAGKRPVMVDGRAASTTDPATWTTFDRVAGGPHGVMLGGGLACIDLDDCLSVDGDPAPWAQSILDAVPTAAVEVSMSGRGLHIYGTLPESAGRRRGQAEVYSRARFIVTTHQMFRPGSGALEDLAPAVDCISRLAAAGLIPGVIRRRSTTL